MSTKNIVDGEKVHQEDLKTIGPKIAKGLRQRLYGKNLGEFSDKTGVKLEVISAIISEQKMISVDEAKKMAKYLECSPQDLIQGIQPGSY